MSKVMDLPDDTTEEHFEIFNRIFVYPIGIKWTGEQLELYLDDERV